MLLAVTYDEYRLVNVDFDFIDVDGDNASSVFNTINSGDINILDGITFGGFNYINPDNLNKSYIIFYSAKPNIEKVEYALRKYFNDVRREIILKVIKNLLRVSTAKGDVYIYTNLNIRVAKEIIEKYQVFDKIPEPLKAADEIASSLSTFLLYKKII